MTIAEALAAAFHAQVSSSHRTTRYAGVAPIVPGPGALATLADGRLVAADRAFAFGVIEGLLGSAKAGPPPERALSDLEWELFVPVLERLCGQAVVARGSDPSVAAFPPAQNVAVAVYDVVCAGFAGRIVVVEPAPAGDGRIEISVGFAIDADDLVPGAVIPLGEAELRQAGGPAFRVTLGAWRERKAARLV